jgi:hypothetical protein
MSSQTISPIQSLTVPPEVCAFAREQGVEQYLTPLIELSYQVFPEASRSQFLLDIDPDIPDDRHIVIRLAVRLEVPASLVADQKWIEGLSRLCPKSHTCVFRLSLDLVP